MKTDTARNTRRERRHTIGASRRRRTGSASSAPRDPDMKAAPMPHSNPRRPASPAGGRRAHSRRPTAESDPKAMATIPKRIGLVDPPTLPCKTKPPLGDAKAGRDDRADGNAIDQ